MDYLTFSRSKTLSNIPERKLHEKILDLVQTCKACSAKNITKIEQAFDGLCEKCSVMTTAYTRYHESNIPVDFWDFDMGSFQGSKTLLDLYNNVSQDIPKAYQIGLSFCFAGGHGTGKSTNLSCLLKKCCEKNYSCLYTTLTDLVNSLIDAPREDKYLVKKELTMIDFLVIDEVDGRFIGSE